MRSYTRLGVNCGKQGPNSLAPDFNFGPPCLQHGATWPWPHFSAQEPKPRAQPAPTLRTPCETLKTCIFYRCFERFLSLAENFCVGMLPTLGVNFRGRCPPHRITQSQVAHVKPNLRPACPHWVQVGANWHEAPALPRTAKCDPSRLWLSTPYFPLSVL